MTTQKALTAIMNGEKVRPANGDEDKYIHLDDNGQIVDSDGKTFNMMTSKEKKWVVWSEPKVINDEVESFDLQNAMMRIMKGEKVRPANGDEDKYIHLDDNGQIVDSDGKTFNMMTSKEKKWVVWSEPKIGGIANSEVLAMVKALKSEILGLKEAQKEALTAKSNNKEDNEDLVKLVYGVGSPSEVKKHFEAEYSQCNTKRDASLVIAKYIPFCWAGRTKINTIASMYRDMRNIIKSIGGDYQDLGLELFSLNANVYDEIADISTSKVKQKNEDEHREVYNKENIEEFISRAKEMILTDDIPMAKQQTKEQARAYLYASYLALVTGRRITEILKTLDVIEDNGEWYYTGIIKKGDDNIKIKAYSLDDDFTFLKGLISQIREDIAVVDANGNELKNTQINSKYNHIFNRSLKRLTETNFTFHDAREIYADMMYLENGLNRGDWSEEFEYKAMILGHDVKKDRLVATESYMTKKGE